MRHGDGALGGGAAAARAGRGSAGEGRAGAGAALCPPGSACRAQLGTGGAGAGAAMAGAAPPPRSRLTRRSPSSSCRRMRRATGRRRSQRPPPHCPAPPLSPEGARLRRKPRPAGELGLGRAGAPGERAAPSGRPMAGRGLDTPRPYPVSGLRCRGGLSAELGSCLAALMPSRGPWGRGQPPRPGPRAALRRNHSRGTAATTCTSGAASAA